MIRVGITGGIGSGKSTVCELFGRLGRPIYDSDSRARELINEPLIQEEIVRLLGPGAYRNGIADRLWIAGKVFADRELLASLNAIVHPVVAEDFEAWALARNGSEYVILESAILFESGFDRLVDRTVAITAPRDVRIERVLGRDRKLNREDVTRRMDNQMSDDERAGRADYTIDNSGSISELAAQVEKLDKLLKQ